MCSSGMCTCLLLCVSVRTAVRPRVDQDYRAWRGAEFQRGKQKVFTAMFVEWFQWYDDTAPLEVRALVEALERLTPSEGQPVDPEKLEELGLVVMDCVADGPPLQVEVLASVDIRTLLEDVNADDLDGPWPLFLASAPRGHRT